MDIITTQSALDDFCKTAQNTPFICVDTEFMRENTFYSNLCLIQLATQDSEAIIDPLVKDLDLAPLIQIMLDTTITKVMHAARQDIEIFYRLCQAVPKPLFDTQIAAMALGFGDGIGYNGLVKGYLGLNLDKGARFTDWSHRPLSNKQLHYALGDVTHLRDLYPDMIKDLKARNRLSWVDEEMQSQLDPELYEFNPDTAWLRLKVRHSKRNYLATLKAVAAWREIEAKSRNIPRRRVLKDEALYDLALNQPLDQTALARLRGIPNGFDKSASAKRLIQHIAYAFEHIDSYAPDPPIKRTMPSGLGPKIEMLKTLLRLCCDYQDIAPRLVANASDIEMIAAFEAKAKVPALSGWRREIFGNDALAMCDGKIALRLEGNKVVSEPIEKNGSK